MIPARKTPILEKLLRLGLLPVVRRRFYGVFLRGLERVRAHEEKSASRPLILCANHGNWWDGFAIALVAPFFPGRAFYVAQEERLLARYWPLRWLGAFGLDLRGTPLPGLRYALRLLAEPKNAVWIFPQGELLPQWKPVKVRPGALWLARKSGAEVMPVAFRYEWMVESRPSLFIHFGEALTPDSTPEALGGAIQALYDEIGRTLAPVDLSAYHPLFTPRPSLNLLWDWMHGVRQTRNE